MRADVTSRGRHQRPGNVNRPAGRPKVAGRPDRRPNKPSGLGNVDRGKHARVKSNRGQRAMGGGQRGGGRAVQNRSGGETCIAAAGAVDPSAAAAVVVAVAAGVVVAVAGAVKNARGARS